MNTNDNHNENDNTNYNEVLIIVANLSQQHGEEAVKGFAAHMGGSLIAELDNFSDVYSGLQISEIQRACPLRASRFHPHTPYP